VIPSGVTIFEEHFDQCAAGAYIGNCDGWIPLYNAADDKTDNIITNTESVSSPNSAQIYGSHSSDWSAAVYRPVMGTHLLLRANIRSSGTSSGSFHYIDIGVYLGSTNDWFWTGGAARAEIDSPGNGFCGQGMVFEGSGTDSNCVVAIPEYANAINQWFDVAVEINYSTAQARFWLNGNYRGQSFIDTTDTVSGVAMQSGNGEGWVDDIVIQAIPDDDDDVSPDDDDDDDDDTSPAGPILNNGDFDTGLSSWTIVNPCNPNTDAAGSVSWSANYDGSANVTVSGAPGSACLVQNLARELHAGEVVELVVYHTAGTSAQGGWALWINGVEKMANPANNCGGAILCCGTLAEGLDVCDWTADADYAAGSLISLTSSVWPGTLEEWYASIGVVSAGCNALNCPGGCCSGTTCEPGATDASCGTVGKVCVNCRSLGEVCGSGQACAAPPTGTWVDSTSGRMWQVTPPTNGPDSGWWTWSQAQSYCSSLRLGGYTDWKLPDVDAFRSLIRGCAATQSGGSCTVTDSCLNSSCEISACSGCSGGQGPASGCYWPSQLTGQCVDTYWSSSAVGDIGADAWNVFFWAGSVLYYPDVSGYGVRCVR
jgi:hypothetical protein